MERAFQVDLRGIVDLLSHHLYTGPRVYLRELLQNAVDAITARRLSDPHVPAMVTIEPPESTGDGTLRVHDTGVGLTEPQVHELLATIGGSSKRDDLGFARREFLGQFGIGLLSCFLVADRIRVLTRAAAGAPTIEWTATSDGRYRVEPAAEQRSEPGTTVTLTARPGMEHSRSLLTRCWLGLWVAHDGRAEEGVALTAGAVATLRDGGDDLACAWGEHWLAYVLAGQGRRDEAYAALRRAAAHAAASTDLLVIGAIASLEATWRNADLTDARQVIEVATTATETFLAADVARRAVEAVEQLRIAHERAGTQPEFTAFVERHLAALPPGSLDEFRDHLDGLLIGSARVATD